MYSSTTMTIRVPSDVKAKLERIAADTRRSKSFLAAEALAAYVEQELAIIDGIAQGRADADAGRIVPHDKAMDELDGVIEAAHKA
jgi:predicted transcriptional regulator